MHRHGHSLKKKKLAQTIRFRGKKAIDAEYTRLFNTTLESAVVKTTTKNKQKKKNNKKEKGKFKSLFGLDKHRNNKKRGEEREREKKNANYEPTKKCTNQYL